MMKTKIIFEDEDILVCHKPAGIAVQASAGWQQDVESELKNYLASKAGNRMPYLAVIHRLDQPVCGLLVFAKNKKAAASLSAQIQDGRAGKQYKALVHGVFEEEQKEGSLEHMLLKEPGSNISCVVQANAKEAAKAKKAKLNYKVIREVELSGEICSEVEIELLTGRHHQIRLQFSEIGHPIVGDQKYGRKESIGSKGLKLCAFRLSFIHPSTNKKVVFETTELYQ